MPPFTPRQLELQRQIAQAQALMDRPRQQFSDPFATAIGGLGDVLGAGFGAYRTRTLGNQFQEDVAKTEADTAAKAAALKDPNSPESVAARQRAGQLLGKYATPDQLAGITAENAADSIQALRSVAGLGLQEQNALATREATSQERQADREFREMMQGGQQAFTAQQAREGRAFQAGQQRASQEFQLGLERMRGETKQASEAKGTDIVGLEKMPGAAPTADDAKRVKGALVSQGKMRGFIRDLRALHQKYGTELGGPAATNMGQLSTAISLEAKNIAELGALSGPDKAIMDAIASADPASLVANAKSMMGVDNTEAALQGLERWMDTQVDTVMRTYGYQPSQQPQRVPAPVSPSGTMTLGGSGPAPKPDLRSRIAQLKAQGLSQDKIMAQVKNEGLVP